MNMGVRMATIVTATVVMSWSAAAHAQHEGHVHEAAPGESQEQHAPDRPAMHDHGHASSSDSASTFLMQQSSGTSTQPSGWPMPMKMWDRAGWQLGLMGQVFLVHTSQWGPRGSDGAYSVNWSMGSASRRIGRGRLQLRGMLSLEPATVRHRSYPLLFQTGETAYGTPLVDAQHPHDFLMELSAQYVVPLGDRTLLDLYYAPVGDPAIGPVAFPHRASALELPQATLGHHWEDSTHIASNVATFGWARGPVRLEASAFHGGEPDESRWNLDVSAMDSWSTRVTVAPTANWTGQLSFARLARPESLHPDDVERTTASIHHARPSRDGPAAIATSVIWATNRKSVERTRTHALTLESMLPLTVRDLVSARFEWSQRDELFEYDHELARHIEDATGKTAFGVSALTAAYTRDVFAAPSVVVGLGGSATCHWADAALEPHYGGGPWGASVFLRARLR